MLVRGLVANDVGRIGFWGRCTVLVLAHKGRSVGKPFRVLKNVNNSTGILLFAKRDYCWERERERRAGKRGEKRNTIIYLLYLCYNLLTLYLWAQVRRVQLFRNPIPLGWGLPTWLFFFFFLFLFYIQSDGGKLQSFRSWSIWIQRSSPLIITINPHQPSLQRPPAPALTPTLGHSPPSDSTPPPPTTTDPLHPQPSVAVVLCSSSTICYANDATTTSIATTATISTQTTNQEKSPFTLTTSTCAFSPSKSQPNSSTASYWKN